MTVITTLRTLTLSIILASVSYNATAQVTLGSTEAPNPGALLDLKEKDETTRGLGLPRVSLLTNKSLEPCLTDTESDDPDQRKAHIGLVVYNVGDEIETTKEDRLCKGMHVWDGNKWQPLTAYFDPDITRSGRKEDLTIQRGTGGAEVTTYTTAYFHGYSRKSTSNKPSNGSVYVCDKSKLMEIDAGQWMTMNMRTKYLPGKTTEILPHSGDKHHEARYFTPEVNPATLDPIDVDRNGLLYNWPAATAERDPLGQMTTSEYSTGTPRIQGICPDTWHIPDIQELEELRFLFLAQHHLFSNVPFTPSPEANYSSPNDATNAATSAAMTSAFNGGSSFSPEQGGMDWRRVGARWGNWNTQSPASGYGKSGFIWSSTSGPVAKNGEVDEKKWNFRAFGISNGFVKGYSLGTIKVPDTNKEIITASSGSYRSRVILQSVRCKKD